MKNCCREKNNTTSCGATYIFEWIIIMNDSLRKRSRAHIKHGEGSINHMYLDTVGKVTVGVGNSGLVKNSQHFA
jgi:hypothetical protein